ncbi:hypothetical protein [Oceanobacillus sp. FSL H7-0719]|uniref:hypothetical protein n=1 Tax=Oceanobacillus sp. FSL H7-0719 TaxID=2954507 RepID=UPI00324571EE
MYINYRLSPKDNRETWITLLDIMKSENTLTFSCEDGAQHTWRGNVIIERDDVFKLNGEEYKVREVVYDPDRIDDMYWMEPVIHRDSGHMVSGGENKILHYNDIIKLEYLVTNF